MAELKEQALLERIGQLTVQYEDRIADLRVELTRMAQEKAELQSALNIAASGASPPASAEVLEGVVV